MTTAPQNGLSQVSEHWLVQNTGWTHGLAWFEATQLTGKPKKFESEADALAYVADNRGDAHWIRWRVVHVWSEKTSTGTAKKESWVEVPDSRSTTPLSK